MTGQHDADRIGAVGLAAGPDWRWQAIEGKTLRHPHSLKHLGRPSALFTLAVLASTRIPLPVGGPQHDLHSQFSGRTGCRAACILSRARDVSLGQAAGPED